MGLDMKDAERLCKLLEMTSSEHEGEALNALRMAQKFMKEHKKRWGDVIAVNMPATAPTIPIVAHTYPQPHYQNPMQQQAGQWQQQGMGQGFNQFHEMQRQQQEAIHRHNAQMAANANAQKAPEKAPEKNPAMESREKKKRNWFGSSLGA